MGDESETWDELMGPSSDQLKNMLRMDDPVEPPPQNHQEEPPAPVVRSSSRARGAPPPSKAFSMPDRWAQLEPEAEQVNEATRQAVATARGAAAASSATFSSRRSNSNNILSDDDMDNSNNSHRAGSICSGRSLHFEDEHEDESASELESEQDDSHRIRQEALRMLEVADDQLADSTYSVYRTKTGGFMASARTLGSQKRVPTALAGIATRAVSSVSTAASSSSASSRRGRNSTGTMRRSVTAAKPYRDDPTSSEDESSSSRSMANEKLTREDYEYGDERVVDVVGMEKRFASSRAGEEPRNSSSKTASRGGGGGGGGDGNGGGNNWSSRYSIDDTLLALSGGAQSGSKFLDKLDKEHEAARNNMFAGSPRDARNTNVFGSGYSFRQKHVFGKQGVVAAKSTPSSSPNNKAQKGETNLRTVWMDAVPNTPPVTSASPARSWQEQLTLKRKQRRNLILVAFAVLVFIITLASVLGSHKSKQRAAAADDTPGADAAATNQVSDAPNTNTADVPQGSLTFYVTSDVPLDTAGELQLMKDLDAVSRVADFIVHLGNIQNATTTGCNPHRYGEVAEILEESPLTVFMVPGEEDWSNCPDQDEAWDAWYDNFVSFDEKFEQSFGVTRQYEYQENFAFVDSGVLFVGVHEVNGRMYDPEELQLRNQANFRWVVENGNRYRSGIRAMVIFANGRPLLESNDDFYAPLGDFLYNFGVPTAYIHANDGYGEEEMMYKLFEYGGMEHVIAIQTSKGETRSPLRINVGFSETDPFIVG